MRSKSSSSAAGRPVSSSRRQAACLSSSCLISSRPLHTSGFSASGSRRKKSGNSVSSTPIRAMDHPPPPHGRPPEASRQHQCWRSWRSPRSSVSSRSPRHARRSRTRRREVSPRLRATQCDAGRSTWPPATRRPVVGCHQSHGDRLLEDLARAGFEAADLDLRRPCRFQVVPGGGGAVGGVHHQRGALAGRRQLPRDHRSVPGEDLHGELFLPRLRAIVGGMRLTGSPSLTPASSENRPSSTPSTVRPKLAAARVWCSTPGGSGWGLSVRGTGRARLAAGARRRVGGSGGGERPGGECCAWRAKTSALHMHETTPGSVLRYAIRREPRHRIPRVRSRRGRSGVSPRSQVSQRSIRAMESASAAGSLRLAPVMRSGPATRSGAPPTETPARTRGRRSCRS